MCEFGQAKERMHLQQTVISGNTHLFLKAFLGNNPSSLLQSQVKQNALFADSNIADSFASSLVSSVSLQRPQFEIRRGWGGEEPNMNLRSEHNV